jgi:hypothetical protein
MLSNPLYDPYQILMKVYSDGAHLKQAIADTYIEELNRARTVKIVYGVLENDLWLDYAIRFYAPKSPKLAVRVLLKIALYMLLYLEKQKYVVTNCAVELCKKLGKAQSTLSNKLRLLKLNDEMRYKISRAGLSERHARALLSLNDEVQRARALSIIIDRHLTVSESEALIEQMLRKNETPKRQILKGFKDIRIFINTLNNAVDAIRRAGIDADSVKTETDEYVEYIVRIPKLEDRPMASNQ